MTSIFYIKNKYFGHACKASSEIFIFYIKYIGCKYKMSSDFETIEYLDDIKEKDTNKKNKKEKKPKKEKKTLSSGIIDALANTNLKLLFFIFISFIFINTDIFIDKILSRVDGAVEHRSTTSKGVIIQSICLILLFVMADVLIQVGVI